MSEVQTVDYTMKVPKEFKDVTDLLDAILENVLAKKKASEYANVLDELMEALDGIGGVSAEVKSQYRDEAAGYLVHKLMGRLMPIEAAEPAQ